MRMLGKIIGGPLRRHHGLDCFALHLFAYRNEVVLVLRNPCGHPLVEDESLL